MTEGDARLGPETTAEEVAADIDLTGTTIVVTGASSGLGVETARVLATRGASVIAANRPGDKGDRAVERIQSASGGEVTRVALDLGASGSVRRCASEIRELASDIDVLVNNAGVMATPFARTHDGFEQQFGINHLGHFLLTLELMDALRAGAGGRVVCLSSAGHWRSGVHFDDVDFTNRAYDKWEAYGQSKSANALHAFELHRRHGDEGVSALSVHPGMIATDLGRHLSPEDITELMRRTRDADPDHRASDDIGSPPNRAARRKDVAQGAATTVWAATTPDIGSFGGAYCEDCAPARPVDEPGDGGAAPWIRDPDAAGRLWELSRERTAA